MIISALHCLPPSTIHCSHDLGEQLRNASRDGHVDKVKRLLARGAPVDWRDRDGWTVLHWACYYNQHDVVKIFTQQDGIDVNVRATIKDTPLHLACYWGHLKCVQLLMATGQCDLGKSVCVSCNTLRPYYLQFIAELTYIVVRARHMLVHVLMSKHSMLLEMFMNNYVSCSFNELVAFICGIIIIIISFLYY